MLYLTRRSPRQTLHSSAIIRVANGIGPKKHKSSKKENSNLFNDEPASTLSEPFPPPEYDSSPWRSPPLEPLKIPDLLGDPFICYLLEPLASPIHLPALKPAVCPLCKKEVDRDLFTEHQEANPAKQSRSCRGSALDTGSILHKTSGDRNATQTSSGENLTKG